MIRIVLEKMAKLFANSGYPDSAASELGLHRLLLVGVGEGAGGLEGCGNFLYMA